MPVRWQARLDADQAKLAVEAPSVAGPPRCVQRRGWQVDSLALLADAGHCLSDVAGLMLAWGGALAGRLRPDAHHSYGSKRAGILAAFANALLLVVAGALALLFGWNWLDPVVSLVIAAVIVVATWSLFRQSLHLLFDGVPERIDLGAVRSCLEALPGIDHVHDLHVWTMGSNEVAMTAQLVIPNGQADDAFLESTTRCLQQRFGIDHVTLQVVRRPFSPACGQPRPIEESNPADPHRHAGKQAGHDH